MEDAHVHILDFTGSADGEVPSSYYAVFDGHFNGAVAEYCGANVHLRVKETPEYRKSWRIKRGLNCVKL